jgi:hypothetical protein
VSLCISRLACPRMPQRLCQRCKHEISWDASWRHKWQGRIRSPARRLRSLTPLV